MSLSLHISNQLSLGSLSAFLVEIVSEFPEPEYPNILSPHFNVMYSLNPLLE